MTALLKCGKQMTKSSEVKAHMKLTNKTTELQQIVINSILLTANVSPLGDSRRSSPPPLCTQGW